MLRLEFWRVVRSASENSPCGAPKDGREGTKAGGMEVTMVTRDGRESTGSLEKEGQGKGDES